MAESEDTGKLYLLNRNARELDRLAMQHEFYKICTKNHLVAPQIIAGRGDLKILDAGCADGNWLRDFRGQFATHGIECFGVDISQALFPSNESQTASGIDLRAHDITKTYPPDWNWKNSFDIVHQRLLVWGVPAQQWPTVLRNHLEVLKPGGWIQLTEVAWVTEGGFPAERPQLQRMEKMQRWFSKKNGMDIDIAYKLEDLLRESGFDAIEKVQYDLNYGSLAPPEWREKSAAMASKVFSGLAERMEGNSIPGVAATPDEFLVFLEQLEKDLFFHGYQPQINFVFARKPF